MYRYQSVPLNDQSTYDFVSRACPNNIGHMRRMAAFMWVLLIPILYHMSTTLNYATHRNLEKQENSFCVNGHQLPRFILLGAMKCGTTTLANLLFHKFGFKGAEFCNVAKSSFCHKEPHFYDHEGRDTTLHDSRYLKLFPKCTNNDQYIMDGTPANANFLNRISAMYTESQKNELVFLQLVCDPVKRFESAWNHCVRDGYVWDYVCRRNVTIDEEIEHFLMHEPGLRKGYYGEILSEARRLFPTSTIITISNKYFFENEGETLNTIFKHSGVPYVANTNINKKANSAEVKKIKLGEKSKAILSMHYEPHMEMLREVLSKDNKLILVPNSTNEFMKFI